MRLRGLILLLTMYVALDLANPFMPGAFEFDADSSVEVTRRHVSTSVTRGAMPVTPQASSLPSSGRPMRVERPIGPPPAVTEWLGDLRARHAAPAEPPSPSDDH